MAAPEIGPLPPAPLPNDSKTAFNAKAFPFVAALDVFRQEINAFGAYVGTEVDIVKTIRAPDDIPALPGPAGRANRMLWFDGAGVLNLPTPSGVRALLNVENGAQVNPTDSGMLTSVANASGVNETEKLKARDFILNGISINPSAIRTALNVANGATANATDAQLRSRATHTGTQSADTIVDGTTNKVFTAAEKTKLAGVQNNATANATNAQLRDRATHTGTQAISTVTGLGAALDAKLDDSQLRSNLASPDNSSVPSTLAVASAIADSMAGETPRGAWNASTNTPSLASSVGTAGYWYEVSVAGTTDLNGETGWQVGDKAIFNGIIWTRVPANAVRSVDGRTGDVILNYDTPAQAALASIPVGAKYSTKGAVTVGDGGHGTFIQSATAPTDVDGFSCFESANGTFGVLQPKNHELIVEQFGAFPNGTSAVDGITRGLKAMVDRIGSELAFDLCLSEGEYLIDKSFSTTSPTTGRTCFDIRNANGWKFKGRGMRKSLLCFDPADNRGARVLDVMFCDYFEISDMGFIGVRTPTLNVSGTIAALGYMDRGINTVVHKGALFKNIYIYQASRYSMGHERGPYVDNTWENIVIEWSGNDGIDMKTNNVDGVFTKGINQNNTFINIIGIQWGNLVYTAPNVLLDLRTANSNVYTITGYHAHDGSILVRTIGGVGSKIYSPSMYGAEDEPLKDQVGVSVATNDIRVFAPKFENIGKGVENKFNSPDGSQPSVSIYSLVASDVSIACDIAVGKGKVYGGEINGSSIRGIYCGSGSLIDGVTFSDCESSGRFISGSEGSVIQNCNAVNSGLWTYAGGATTAGANTVMNCDGISTDYCFNFVGRKILVNGGEFELRGDAIIEPTGAIPVYADEAAATAAGLAQGRRYRSSDGILRIKL